MNNEKGMNFRLISAKDHAESFLNVKTGRAVAFVMPDPLLYGAKAGEADADDYLITGSSPMSEVSVACSASETRVSGNSPTA